MNVSISTACLSAETEDALTAINNLGRLAEVKLKTFYEYRPEFAKKCAQNLNGLKASFVGVNPNNFEAQLFDGSRRVRGDGFYWLDQIMRSAQLFKADKYCLCGGKLNDGEDLFARLNEIQGFCSHYGVLPCVVNAPYGVYGKAGLFKRIKENCPSVSGVLDIANAKLSGYPYGMFLADMQGAVSAVRVPYILTGETEYFFKELLKRLKDTGFSGDMILTAQTDDLSLLKRTAEYFE